MPSAFLPPLPMWTGVRFLPWLRVLARNGFRVSPSRWPRAAFITGASLGNEVLRGLTLALWGRGLRAARLEADPVLLLGHWRSGTTLLHELIACDPAFRAPTTLQCAVPSHFVLSEQFARERLGFLLPAERPMDGMRLGFERPQEDELALCNLGLPSPWWIVAFPNEPPPDAAWEDLETLPPRDRDRWVAAWTGFLRAVQFEHPGRLVLKNPLHTHRVPLIRSVFPKADFIQIVRDPATLVPSCLHFWRRISESHGLQRPRRGPAADRALEDRVIASVLRMDRRLEAAWETLPPRQRYRLRYEDLVADPVAALRALYAHFDWPGVEVAEPAWRQRLAEQREYRPNRHAPEPQLARRIARELAAFSARHGYPGEARACETPPGSNG